MHIMHDVQNEIMACIAYLLSSCSEPAHVTSHAAMGEAEGRIAFEADGRIAFEDEGVFDGIFNGIAIYTLLSCMLSLAFFVSF